MRFSALAPVLLLGTLAAGCVDQRAHVYSGSYCDDYGCGAPVAPVVQYPAYGGGPGYGGHPGYWGGRYRGGPYGGPPPAISSPACSEC